MKNRIIILMLVGILMSCGKNDDEINELVIYEEVTINNTETFSYDLGPFGDEQGAGIVKQAKNYEISEIIPKNLDEKVYKYKTKSGFIGTDFVEIKRMNFIISTGKISEINTIKISFTITD